MNKLIIFLLLLVQSSYSQSLSCFTEFTDMYLSGMSPYTKIKVGKSEGYFLIDFGTTASSIDTNGFLNVKPTTNKPDSTKFDNFEFFGSWGTVTLNIQDHSNILGIKQAGIIGTDFLSLNAYLLDYSTSRLWRTTMTKLCDDNTLRQAGFRYASTAGYYSNLQIRLNNTCTVNVPTIPIKLGSTMAVAQIDPGYDDRILPHSLNINQAFYKAIIENGVMLKANPAADFTLSTCIQGIQESVKAYKVPQNTEFAILDPNGLPIVVHSDINIFLKQTPVEAKKCGGIGAWTIPAAQLGASFLIDSEKIIFDPYGERVWFYTK